MKHDLNIMNFDGELAKEAPEQGLRNILVWNVDTTHAARRRP